MILQIDPRLRDDIKQYGCYYFCLLYLANKYANAQLSAARINGSLYFKLVQEGAMTTGCYINSPDTVLRVLGLHARYTGVHESPEYQCAEDECEVLRFEYGKQSHFVVGDGRGNVAFDPMGVSQTVAEGRLMSKRIFKIPRRAL